MKISDRFVFDMDAGGFGAVAAPTFDICVERVLEMVGGVITMDIDEESLTMFCVFQIAANLHFQQISCSNSFKNE